MGLGYGARRSWGQGSDLFFLISWVWALFMLIFGLLKPHTNHYFYTIRTVVSPVQGHRPCLKLLRLVISTGLILCRLLIHSFILANLLFREGLP